MDIAPRCPWYTLFSRWEDEPPAKNRVTTAAYPLYDTHGNMVATLTKNANGTSWNVGNERWYDVWGGVRSGNATGGPKGRYCANLGHVQDDESGLIYMRARYYEPSTGRFISEDPARDGVNWFIYGNNAPTLMVDANGLSATLNGTTLAVSVVAFTFGATFASFASALLLTARLNAEQLLRVTKIAIAGSILIGIGVSGFTSLIFSGPRTTLVNLAYNIAVNVPGIVSLMKQLESATAIASTGATSPAKAAVKGYYYQMLVTAGYVVALLLTEEGLQ